MALSKLKLEKQRALAQKNELESVLSKRKRYKDKSKLLQAIYSKKIRHQELPTGSGYAQIAQILQDTTSSLAAQKDFYTLLEQLTSIKTCKLLEDATLCNSLFLVSQWLTHKLRPLKSWQPQSHNTDRQFSHLLRHLFGRYEIPLFMDDAWRSGEESYIGWFLHIGQGYNLRTRKDLPFAMTKKMVHHFLQAPANYTVLEALRWAQIKTLGGNEPLIRSIIATRLGREMGRDTAFWTSFFDFLVQTPMLDKVHINPMVDFIFFQKFEGMRVINAHGRREYLEPPQPNFSMKGRTAESLLRAVETWHSRLDKSLQAIPATWEPVYIADFVYQEGKNTYRIEQLLSQKELQLEGRSMRHCVASYAQSCVAGRCSIWSLVVEKHQHTTRLVTLELSKYNILVQARKKYNEMPTEKEMDIINRWVLKEGLTLSKWIRY